MNKGLKRSLSSHKGAESSTLSVTHYCFNLFIYTYLQIALSGEELKVTKAIDQLIKFGEGSDFSKFSEQRDSNRRVKRDLHYLSNDVRKDINLLYDLSKKYSDLKKIDELKKISTMASNQNNINCDSIFHYPKRKSSEVVVFSYNLTCFFLMNFDKPLNNIVAKITSILFKDKVTPSIVSKWHKELKSLETKTYT